MRRLRPPLGLLLGGILACAFLPTAAAEDATFPQRAAALDKQAALALDALASHCAKKMLFGKRDEVYERLLALEPDHEAARKKLKYEKGEDGSWVQDPRYKRARNLKRGGLEEADATLAEILAARVTGLVTLCREAQAIHDLLWARRTLASLHTDHPTRKDIAPAERDLALRYHAATREKGLVAEMAEVADWLRERHPTDMVVRDALGEVEREGVWLLHESARTLDRRAGLADAVGTAKKVLPTTSKPTPAEAKVALPWKQAVATKHVRVAGTAEAEHLQAVAVACESAGAVFEQALGTAPAWRAGLTVYLFAGEKERATFLKAYPVRENPTLKHADKLDLVYADGNTLAVRGIQPRGQLDLAVNEVLNVMLSDTFLGHETPLAWHAEGISRYLAWLLTDTRMAINVSNKYAGDKQDRAVPDADAAWLPHVRTRLEKKPAALQLLLGKGTDAFTARDALVAYGFAIYLIHGFDGLAGPFLRAHWKTKDVDRTCRDLLATPRPVVEHRMRRWLDEVITGTKGSKR